MWRTGSPASSSARSNVNEQPIRNATRSSRQSSRTSVRLLGQLAVAPDAVARQVGAQVGAGRERRRLGRAGVADLEHRARLRVAQAEEQEVERVGLRQHDQVGLRERRRQPGGRARPLAARGSRRAPPPAPPCAGSSHGQDALHARPRDGQSTSQKNSYSPGLRSSFSSVSPPLMIFDSPITRAALRRRRRCGPAWTSLIEVDRHRAGLHETRRLVVGRGAAGVGDEVELDDVAAASPSVSSPAVATAALIAVTTRAARSRRSPRAARRSWSRGSRGA